MYQYLLAILDEYARSSAYDTNYIKNKLWTGDIVYTLFPQMQALSKNISKNSKIKALLIYEYNTMNSQKFITKFISISLLKRCEIFKMGD